MRVHQQGTGNLRPLVVAYHVSGAALLGKVSPRTTVASYVAKPLTGAYRTTSAANPTLDDLVQQLGAQLGAEAFWPIVLVGFSEGCQGIRHQLQRKLYPAATVAIDGVHASDPPAQASQIDVWREWFTRCGADLSSPREQCEPIEGLPIAIQTFTQIPTFDYLSTSATARAITGWTWPRAASADDPATLCSGNVWIHSFPGGNAAAHEDQGQRVLPAAVEGLARELGFGPDSPAPPAPPPDQPPPDPGEEPTPLASVARRVLPAVALAGALALAAIEAEDHG